MKSYSNLLPFLIKIVRHFWLNSFSYICFVYIYLKLAIAINFFNKLSSILRQYKSQPRYASVQFTIYDTVIAHSPVRRLSLTMQVPLTSTASHGIFHPPPSTASFSSSLCTLPRTASLGGVLGANAALSSSRTSPGTSRSESISSTLPPLTIRKRVTGSSFFFRARTFY